MNITLRAMHYFTTALRHGNIAKAAAELNIAASAVATAVDQVEGAFDLTLVTRHRARGIMANASGLAVARKCERLLEDYHAILAEGVDLKHALSGRLRIGYYAPVAPAFLPKVLASFVPDLRAIEVHLDECDNNTAQEGLLTGAYDVILFVNQNARPTIEYDVLTEAPPYCLLPASHPLAAQPSVSMHDIAQQPLVVLDRPVVSAYYRGLFDSQPDGPKITAYANSTEMVRSLVSAGHGLAILNMTPATQEAYTGATVVERPIADPLPPLTLAVAYDKSRPRRLVQEFVRACQTHFAQDGRHRYTV